jgi:hypothetical protein
MKGPAKWLFGILCFAPIVSFFYGLFVTPNLAETNHALALSLDIGMEWVLKISWPLAFVLTVAHLVTTKGQLSQGGKVLWATVLLLASMLVFPLYWFLYVGPGSKPVTP